ncbi:hypothetical protein NKG99_24245 [Mesorhizobium sp. M1409]|uniref:helix-turn-helix transcriptional regulator n=1 Tax=unclassified Mesorhizobium TaxID=325217 RepID=UPI003335BE17
MDFSDDDLVTADVACQIIGGRHSPINKATLYRLISRGRVPKPIHPAPGISRWRYGAILAVIAAAEERAA